ncbi:MAG: diguanylate cyclase [Nocardioides sp.]|uniref:GGDEF domain-containing protein n=1 Tax=Nocardioides sp. TaxID=35761 RepID=UPI0039E39F53
MVVLLGLVGVVASLGLAVSAWRHRDTFGADLLVVGGLGAAGWSVGATSALATEPTRSLRMVETFGTLWMVSVSVVCAVFLVFARRSVVAHWHPPRWVRATLIGEPVLVALVCLSRWPVFMVGRFDAEGVYRVGPIFVFHSVYCVALLVAGAAYLLRRVDEVDGARRAALIVIVVLLVAGLGAQVAQFQVMHLVAVAAVAVMYRAVVYERMNDLVPIARRDALDQLPNYLFFFDAGGRLVDVNAPARFMIAATEGRRLELGQEVRQVLGADLELADRRELRLSFGIGPGVVRTVGHTVAVGEPVGQGTVLVLWPETSPAVRRGTGSGTLAPALDAVTGVLTREEIDAVLARAVENADRTGEPLAVLLVDADDFKQINDTRGHLAGDDALRALARCLRWAVDDLGETGRFGGDEFVAVLPGASPEQAVEVAAALIDQLGQPRDPAAGPVPQVSVGVAPYRGGGPRVVLVEADAAMYVAKRRGGGRWARSDQM